MNQAKNPRDIELKWLREVYQGDKMPQLTLRAVLMGSVLGGFMSLSNLYVGLKTGWGFGVAITSCILSFAIYKTLMKTFPSFFVTEMSILENNCMQSTASAAGSSTGTTMVSAIAAYLLVTGHHMPWTVLTWWTFFLAALGVFLAIPLKRQMINIEQLKFPSGIAAAETLKSLHAVGGEATQKAKNLFMAAGFGSLLAWLRDARIPFGIPDYLPVPGLLNGLPMVKWSISFDMSTVMIAAGAIMGWKISWSLFIGAIINYAWLAPKMAAIGAITFDQCMQSAGKSCYAEIVRWSTWTGASIMVASAMLSFVFQWRTIIRAFSGLANIFRKREIIADDPLANIEVPTWWFLLGTALSGGGCLAVLYYAFHTSFIMGIVAVALTFVLGIVACRATGESDITPLGAMGKITQLLFGILAPSNLVTNLMTASVTAGAACSSADLLTDLKSGYVLGANPRKQFIAQFLGIFAGCLIVVPAFYLLVPDASVLGTDRWPAPAAQVWSAVARLLASGLEALHPTAQRGILIGAIVGIILPLADRFSPERFRKFIPSATGIGLAMVIPFYNSLSMFIGGVIALLINRKWPAVAEKYLIVVSSGLIAGESILGILIALLSATGLLS